MSKSVQFKKYVGNPKKINKTFAQSFTSKTINPTDFIDDQEPQLVMNYDSSIYNNANYAVIGNDYYFITDRGLDTAEKMVLYLKKDVLETNKTELLQTDVIPLRVGNDINAFIHDDQDINASYKDVQNYYIGELEFNANSPVILAAMGSRSVI